MKVTVTEEARYWWNHCLDKEQKVNLINQEHPDFLKQSDLMKFAFLRSYNKNPQKLFDKYFSDK